MKFSNAEFRYLTQGHGRKGWAPIGPDCPPKILQGILERRAKMLGSEFVAFQEDQKRVASPSAPYQQPDLEQQIQSSKLF